MLNCIIYLSCLLLLHLYSEGEVHWTSIPPFTCELSHENINCDAAELITINPHDFIEGEVTYHNHQKHNRRREKTNASYGADCKQPQQQEQEWEEE